tara:strand:- start:136731 stop:136916 length:186 start_codon:yes stop_codon:yes gene_type:complete
MITPNQPIRAGFFIAQLLIAQLDPVSESIIRSHGRLSSPKAQTELKPNTIIPLSIAGIGPT